MGSGSEEWEILRGWKYRRCRDKKCDEVGSERYKEGGKREDAEIKRCEEVAVGGWGWGEDIQRGRNERRCRDKDMRNGE